ncbi:glycoside hydrolase superfamily [Tricladium varicosporioides]|nr:glycoside hydrolase superfamily [Hymenoscyphus varicosporioides]
MYQLIDATATDIFSHSYPILTNNPTTWDPRLRTGVRTGAGRSGKRRTDSVRILMICHIHGHYGAIASRYSASDSDWRWLRQISVRAKKAWEEALRPNNFGDWSLTRLCILPEPISNAASPVMNGPEKRAIYQDASIPVPARVADLLSPFGSYQNPAYLAAATIEDVILQFQKNNSLQIPLINVADSVNGVTLLNTTLFPATLSMGQSWNIDLYGKVVDAMSKENRAVGIHWVLSPELDLAREPRYGRVGEMYGEDRYHVGRFGVAYVKNMQATDSEGFSRVATTVKHWIYGSSLGGINEARIIGGMNDFYNVYSYPYMAVFQETNPMALMPSYSSYDDVPMTTNIQYTKNFLRGPTKFDGVIISDYAAITQVLTTQHTAKNIQDAGLKALEATVDHEIGPPDQSGMGALTTLSNNPTVVAAVREAARRVLTLKFLTKTFDEPVPDLKKLNSSLRTADTMQTNMDITRESMVLLKNDGILPLQSSLLSKVAVIGPMADIINPGSYAASDYYTGSTILTGIKKISSNVVFSRGCFRNNDTNFAAMKAEAVSNAKSATLAVVTLGSVAEIVDTNENDRTDGEGFDHADLDFPGPQNELLQAIVETGTPVVLIISGGQAFTMEYAANATKAILHTFLQGELGGDAVAEILTGKTNPSGKLSVSIPRLSSALPIYYNYINSDRKQVGWQVYSDYQTPELNRVPLYPFGYGLSYTKFSISGVSVTNNTSTRDSITVKATIQNTGTVQGKEVVQVYFNQFAPDIERPVKNLIRFAKVDLEPGASTTVSFSIAVSEMGYFVNGIEKVDADQYTIFVGSSSDNADLIATTIAVH